MTDTQKKAHRWFCMTVESILPMIDDEGELKIFSNPQDDKGVGEAYGCFDCDVRLTRETFGQPCMPAVVQSTN